MLSAFNFIDEIITIGFKINLENHNIIYAGYILSIIPTYSDSGIERRYINQILKEMATIYARIVSQYKFKYHI